MDDIRIRDPFILTDPDRGEYYLYGTTDRDPWSAPGIGFDCYRSSDLRRWSGPFPAFRPPSGFWATGPFWAPEVYAWEDRFVMLATFAGPYSSRRSQVLVASEPGGPFEPWGSGPITPPGWHCLDASLHMDNSGDPWIIFCHEWTQIRDGAIVAQRVRADLGAPAGEPAVLFHASDASWAIPIESPDGERAWVTDGPFLHRLRSGALIMIWSSVGEHGYALGVARSVSGDVLGPWVQEPVPLWTSDGGHGMITRTLEGRLILVLHQPNTTPMERAEMTEITESATSIRLLPRAVNSRF